MRKKKPTRPTGLKLKRTANGLECLGDFVRRIRQEKGLSLMEVSKQSALFGPPISGSYINRIERNPKLRVTADRLKALAQGLGIPVRELLAHAVGKMSREEADELALVTRFSELSPQGKS
jgi:transcriptional regulator with XRE-family HTH domain